MTTPSPVTFVPASPHDHNHSHGPHDGQTTPPVAVRTMDSGGAVQGPAAAYQRAPMGSPSAAAPAPVPFPSEDLPVDPELGKPYRPFTIGGMTVRCAAKVPAETMLQVVSAQQQLPDKQPDQLSAAEQLSAINLLGQMLAGVVWPMDAPLLRQRLSDPIDPVDILELSVAVQALWASYNGGTGKGQ
jgi:hypothetical protein